MQEQRETILIERLKETIRTNPPTGEYAGHQQRAAPPVTAEEIARAEIQLGFELPSLLRRLYLEVGNGGFGPGYELYALNANNLSEDSLVTAYLGMRSMSQKDLGEHWADDVKPSL